MKNETEVRETIDGINWEAIKTDALSNLTWDSESDQVIGRSMLGSIFSITPSGKFYTPFACSNVTEAEAELDEYFQEQLSAAAEQNEMFIDHYEENIFACISLELHDVTSDHNWVTSEDYKLFSAALLDEQLENDNSKALALWIVETESENLIDVLGDIIEHGSSVDYGKQSYEVLTDDEADEAFKLACEQYVDECLGLSDIAKRYFDLESFTRDCELSDGRGHVLNRYDGAEECFTFNGVDYYIYRTN